VLHETFSNALQGNIDLRRFAWMAEVADSEAAAAVAAAALASELPQS